MLFLEKISIPQSVSRDPYSVNSETCLTDICWPSLKYFTNYVFISLVVKTKTTITSYQNRFLKYWVCIFHKCTHGRIKVQFWKETNLLLLRKHKCIVWEKIASVTKVIKKKGQKNIMNWSCVGQQTK